MYEFLQYISSFYSFISYSNPQISTSAELTHTKLSSFISLYIQKVFTEGFVHKSFIAWFIERLVHKNMAKMFFLCLVAMFSDLWSDKKEISLCKNVWL